MTKTRFEKVQSLKGLVMAKNSSTLELKNIKFKDCRIVEREGEQFLDGGALSIKNSRLELTNSVFENVVGQNGACVYSDSKISFYSLRDRLLAVGPVYDTVISNS